jgi:hypothetical protein
MGILEIALVGVALSAIIEVVKNKFGTEGYITKAITIGLALLIGGIIYFLQDTAFWETFLGVLATASTVYAFLLKK